MANMSYCRFENTVDDLQDCYEGWADVDEDSSEEERRSQRRLLKICQRIVADYGQEKE